MRAAFLRQNGRFEVEEIPEPEPSGHQVLVKVTYCGICGSDLHMVRAGSLPAGKVLGHEITGTVAALGPEVRGLEVGDRITTLSAVPCDQCSPCRAGNFRHCERGWQVFGYQDVAGGYAEYLLSHDSVVEKVPEHLSDEAAAFNEPSIVGLYAVRASRLRLGDTAALIGAGPIGLLVLQAARVANAGPIYVSDPIDHRREVALELGATAAFDPRGTDVAAELRQRLDGVGPDVVFECAGGRGTLQAAIDVVRPGGQVMVPGVNMEEDTISPLALLSKEVEVKASLGGGFLFRTALDYLAAGLIRTEPMVTEIIGLDEVDRAFQTLGLPGDNAVKVLVAPSR